MFDVPDPDEPGFDPYDHHRGLREFDDDPDGPVVGSPEFEAAMTAAGYERTDLPGGAVAYSKTYVL